ncbi:PREDICTED: probable calcium-binding protein CML25 [Nelumbo nucifera]|uniref:Probable calcium-binding protein CML25 n=1 Tax=Nelumbo nucifera TaxID=4432 RepID=A0A1U8B6Q7_NELNU|nr:PREDICTED: probable calcium-binding protein CML25 [Nelumbo nucifera]
MVKVVDLDDNGFIDLNKFIDLNTNNVYSEKVVEHLRHASMIFNVDANGSISLEELDEVLRSLGDDKCLITDYKKIIRAVDSDGDGLFSICLGSIMENFENPMTEGALQKMAKVVDLDDNWFIDLKKFIDLSTNRVHSENVVEDLRNASMIFNVDGNGSISLEELEMYSEVWGTISV